MLSNSASRSLDGPSVVVANPGSLRWMRPVATALADQGLLRAYVTTLVGGQCPERFLRRLPGAARELSVRPLPARVPPDRAIQVGTPSELLRVAAMRADLPTRALETMKYFGAGRFDRGVARTLRPCNDAVVHANSGYALETFRQAREFGVLTVLDYPIAHHRFAARILEEERHLQPEYASTIRLRQVSRAVTTRWEREIDLADKVLALSSFQYRTMIESGVDESKLVVAPLGVELDLFHPTAPDPESVRPFRVLFAGQLSQRKGLSYLVEAFRRVAIPESELTLLGQLVGRRVPWQPHPSIHLHGPVRFFDLPDVYHKADVFVLPSLVEGFPQTALQAMASGLPVIVSENTFGEDVVTDGVDGYIVPIRDPEAIAERLRHLYDCPGERRRMGLAARRRAEDFSWERYGNRVVAAMRDAVSADPRKS